MTSTYDCIAAIYDVLDYPFELLVYQKIRRKFLTGFRHKRILEIGVGTGKNLRYYHRTNCVIGIDQSKNMLQQAKRRSVEASAKVELQIADAKKLDFEDGTFDVVVTSFVIYLNEDKNALLQEIHRLLKPEGELIIIEYKVPNSKLSRKLAFYLTKFTLPLYDLDFSSINTMRKVGKIFSLQNLKEYSKRWIYGSVWTPKTNGLK